MENVNLTITGMICAGCASHVHHALESVSGVQQVHVILGGGTAEVHGTGLDAAALVAAVEAEG